MNILMVYSRQLFGYFLLIFKSFYLARKYSLLHICIYKYVLISTDFVCAILIDAIFYEGKIQDQINRK